MHNSATTISSPSSAIVSYQLAGQLQAKLLDRIEECILTVSFLKNEGIGDCHIQQKVKYVFIKSAFCSAAVIAPDLISSVGAAHKGVVPAPTTDVIKVSICCNQDTEDEDTPVEIIEIYVQ